MTAFRRTEWNYALQRAAQWSEELKKPLIIFEPLRVGYRWANDRLHQFVVAGMRDNAIALQKEKVTYYPYLEKKTWRWSRPHRSSCDQSSGDRGG